MRVFLMRLSSTDFNINSTAKVADNVTWEIDDALCTFVVSFQEYYECDSVPFNNVSI